MFRGSHLRGETIYLGKSRRSGAGSGWGISSGAQPVPERWLHSPFPSPVEPPRPPSALLREAPSPLRATPWGRLEPSGGPHCQAHAELEGYVYLRVSAGLFLGKSETTPIARPVFAFRFEISISISSPLPLRVNCWSLSVSMPHSSRVPGTFKISSSVFNACFCRRFGALSA